jgi:hypothetical protein
MWQKPWKKRENALLEKKFKIDFSDFFLSYILKETWHIMIPY